MGVVDQYTMVSESSSEKAISAALQRMLIGLTTPPIHQVA
jgi:hypothetical protein